MKKALPYLYTIAGAIGLIAIFRPMVAPTLVITSVNDQTKSGRYRFGKSDIEQDFSLMKFTELTSRNGWTVTAKSNDGKSISFDLFRNGKYVRHLRTIIFN